MEPFIGEIRLFAGDFAPRGWMLCDGKLLSIQQFEALYTLLLTTYGGDGQTNFGLPDLRGRAPIHPGHGPGLSYRERGVPAGVESVVLSQQQMPAHSHNLVAAAAAADQFSPEGNFHSITVDKDSQNPTNSYNNGTAEGVALVSLSSKAISTTGGSLPVNTLSPVLPINYIIAIEGIYPSRG
jgi:microcystin-dependent protein